MRASLGLLVPSAVSRVCVRAWEWGDGSCSRKGTGGEKQRTGPVLGPGSSASSHHILGESRNICGVSGSLPSVNPQKTMKRRGLQLETGWKRREQAFCRRERHCCGRHFTEDVCRFSAFSGTPLTYLLSLASLWS